VGISAKNSPKQETPGKYKNGRKQRSKEEANEHSKSSPCNGNIERGSNNRLFVTTAYLLQRWCNELAVKLQGFGLSQPEWKIKNS
jgi:hypothetical protein